MLGQALMRDYPQHYHLFSTREFTYHGNGRTYKNHNRLLERYEGTDGIKTGYTRASGFNLAASVEREGRRLIAVVLGGKSARSRDHHMSKLLDRGFTKVATLVDRESLKAATRKTAQSKSFNVKTAFHVETTPGAKVATAKSSTSNPSFAQYSVQVGAYYGYHLAKRAATKAANRVPELLGNSRVWVSQVKGEKRRIFLARLVGLSKAHATEACEKLKSVKMECLAVKLSKAVQVALNKSTTSSAVPY
jgi:D-alanyl-D-alanine carboxypeptidase